MIRKQDDCGDRSMEELRRLKDQMLISTQCKLRLAESEAQKWRSMAIHFQAQADQWRTLALQFAAESRNAAIALKRLELEVLLESDHDRAT